MTEIVIQGDFKNNNAPQYLREFESFYDTWLMNKYVGGGLKNIRYYCHTRPNINKNSNLTLRNINNNPTRNGIILALKKMGANIKLINNRTNNNENVCDIEVSSSNLHGCELGPEFADLMIDEYPILSIAASFAQSPSVFRGLKELRVKESDRLNLILINLQNCGVKCKTEDDDLYIYPSNHYEIKKNEIQTDFDHRIAMAFCIMGSKIGPLKIEDAESINTSFPTFRNEFNMLGGKIL